MSINSIPKLKIGDLIIEKAIVQGGMGVGISLSGLAAAVAEEGGIGVISSVGLGLLQHNSKLSYQDGNQVALRNEIRKAKGKSNGVIGLNIMVAVTDFDHLVKIAIEEQVDIIFLGAGLPLKIPNTLSLDELKNSKTKVAPIVSSSRAAKIIFQSWDKNYNYVPDAIVVEGPKAGGHLGFKKEQIDNQEYTLEMLIPPVLDVIKPFEEKYNKSIPLIAAGGIYTGEDIFNILQLGAKAVQLGTRFVATHECDAAIEFKQKFIECKKEDLTIIESPVGLPGRALKNTFLKDVSAGIKMPINCPWKCLKTCDYTAAPYCIALALIQARKGNLNYGFAFAGSNAYRIDKILHVKELIASLCNEYELAASQILKTQEVLTEVA